MPEAVNWGVVPTGRLALSGVTNMEVRVAKVTVRFVLPEIVPKVAVIVTGIMLALTAVARPLLPMVATDGADELQVTCAVISKLVPSTKAPVATNCRVIPTGILGLTGVTDMEDRDAAITVRVVVPVEGPVEKLLGMVEVAVMVVIPAAASSNVILAGFSLNAFSGTHTYSAKAPKPNGKDKSPQISSPGRKCFTFLPTASMRPAISDPSILCIGFRGPVKRALHVPLRISRSAAFKDAA